MIKFPEFEIIKEIKEKNYKKKINEMISDGFKLINCQLDRSGTASVWIAFLLKE